jgi:type IV pilus assembly protein PilB
MEGNTEEQGWLASEFLSEDEMRRSRAHALGIPFVLLGKADVSPEALMLIPEPLSRAHSVVVYHFAGDAVEVALLDIADLDKISFLHAGKKIKPRLTDQASITQALLLYQKHLKEKFGSALQAGDADALIRHAALSQASDVHLEMFPGGMRVRYRIQGALHDAMRLTAEAGDTLVRSIKSLAKLFPIAVIQEGKFKIEDENEEAIAVSVANLPGVAGEKITMRLAREHAGQQGFTLTALGLHGKALEQTHAMLHARSGLVLVCGTEGSGKTTTLYTLLDQLEGGRAIATIEETIEHRLLHATQTQTRPEAGLTMLAGLRAVLRSDPDVVLVGTIGSAETALVALEAAARGVLVFAAIDARSAAGAIEKLLSFDIPPKLIASNLLGVLGQRLVKKLSDNKGVAGRLSREEAADLDESANFGCVLTALKEEGQVHEHAAWKDVSFLSDGETKGLIGLQEVLAITSAIKEMILQKAGLEDIEAEARREGMLTLVEDALFKAVQGLLSVEEVLEVASE